MSRLADPTVCPDCRTPLLPAPAGSRCPGCDLVLQGPTAVELWRAVLGADALVERLRREASAPAPAPVPAPVPAPPPAAPGGVRASSVPVVLLALGGMCLFVFAAIFLGVAWSLLGLAGRSLVMAALTASLVGLAVLLTRRGLRASAETLWVVAAALLGLDVVAAGTAGLLGGLDARGTTSLAGCALVALGVGGATWSARAATGRLVSPQVAAVLGAAVLALAQVTRPDPAPAAAVLVPVLLVAAAGARALRLPVVALGTVGAAVLVWLVLLVAGVERAADVAAVGAWWWPLVVASLLATAASVLVDRRQVGPERVRSVGAAAALLPLLVVATCPALVGTAGTAVLLALSGALAALLLVVVLAPPLWARAAAGFAVLLGLGLAALLLLAPAPLVVPRAPQPLTWVVVAAIVAATVATSLGLARGRGVGALLGRPGPGRVVAVPVAVTAAVGVVGLGAWSAVVTSGSAPVAVVVVGLVATAATAVGAWWWREVLPAALVGTGLAAWTGALALWNAGTALEDPVPAAAQTALALPLLVAGLARDRARRVPSATGLLAAGGLLGAVAVQGWVEVARLEPTTRGLLLAAYAVGLVLAASTLARLDAARVVLQALVVPATLLALLAASGAGSGAAGSAVLAVVACGLAAGTVLQQVRGTTLALPGLVAVVPALLAAAWRATDALPAPELASLPAGAVLAVGGAWMVLQDRHRPSGAALAPALVTVLVPSLVLALGDPVSPRGALVAVLVLALLVVGVTGRLAAAFVAGAVGSALLLLAHLEPAAAAVPRWVAIGLVGSLLLAAGITWESSLRRLAGARRYLAALR